MASKSQAENGRGYFLTGDDTTWFYRQYLPALGDDSEPEAGLANAEANLAYANVNRVASAVVATAEFDPLRMRAPPTPTGSKRQRGAHRVRAPRA